MKSSARKLLFALVASGLLFSCAHFKAETTSSVIEDEGIALIEQEISKYPGLLPYFEKYGDPIELLARFREGKRKAEEEWQHKQSSLQKIKNLGTIKTLEILPLTEWYTCDDSLKGESSVSYLIKTDRCTVLFDLGLNPDQIHPSPLLHNMQQLGIALDDFDAIVISHKHGDHLGGGKWGKLNTFSLTGQQIDLGPKRVYTPVPMTYPGLTPVYTEDPTIISEGVATIGVISSQLFFFDSIAEQALAINVEGKGIVLISGCGHQTLPKIIERAEILFDEPIYGLIGGLHYPVTDSWGEIKRRFYVGTGKVPWEPITMEEVQNNIEFLRKRNPGVVGLSSHDSCDGSVEAFRSSFPGIYKYIKVGEKIVIGRHE